MISQFSARSARFRVSNPNFLRDHDGNDTLVARFNDRMAAGEVRRKAAHARVTRKVTPTGRVLQSLIAK